MTTPVRNCLLLLFSLLFLSATPGRALIGCVDGTPCSEMTVRIVERASCHKDAPNQAPIFPTDKRCIYQVHPAAPAETARVAAPAMDLAPVIASMLACLLEPQVRMDRALPVDESPPLEPDPKQGHAARAPPACA